VPREFRRESSIDQQLAAGYLDGGKSVGRVNRFAEVTWTSKQSSNTVLRKKTGRRTIPPAGQPSSTRGRNTRIVEPKPDYMRLPMNVAGASGDGELP
jgi:hypothetical protein